jgi:PPK2 family polyphosphate:nucleotide phosphotransferase
MPTVYAWRLAEGKRVSLDHFDPRHTGDFHKSTAEARLLGLQTELGELQELCYAAQHHAVLIVLQGMDTSGKDGTIKKVMDSVNPQGCQVTAFKTPSPLELSHDFLWRVHGLCPERGMFGIFNRSHYEDVLIVRVHGLVPEAVWRKRYDQINEFEQLLAENQTIIVKFFLHISKEEQAERLREREMDKDKRWKLNPGDYQERQRWDEYMRAYEDVLTRCATAHAPWYVVPGDHKWFRNLAVARTLVDILRPYREEWRKTIRDRGKANLEAVLALRAKGEAEL